MSANSNIQWTDHTWPITAGCEKVSPGCKHCYAMWHSWRLAHNPNPKISAAYAGVVSKGGKHLNWTGEVRFLPERIEWPQKWKNPARIFVGNMSDIFHKDITDDQLKMIFEMMAHCHWHTFQVLTKRPERALDFYQRYARLTIAGDPPPIHNNPWHHIHFGVSVENQAMADLRLPLLRQIPAATRFVSYEPALEAVDFTEHLGAFHWLIIGGESGIDALPFDVRWAESAIEQCRRWNNDCALVNSSLGQRTINLFPINIFVKQLGPRPYQSPESEGGTGYALALSDKKGGNINEWPEALRIREFP